jgi:TPR repeat protein
VFSAGQALAVERQRRLASTLRYWRQCGSSTLGSKSARHWYQKAADAGDRQAMVNLGVLLETADPPELDGTWHWYQKAADAGHRKAMVNLGVLLQKAEPPDLDGARHWYQKAADAGDRQADVFDYVQPEVPVH